MSVRRTDAARTSPAATTAPAARASRSAIGLDHQGTALGIDKIQPAMTGRGYAHLEKWMSSWLEGQADVNRGALPPGSPSFPSEPFVPSEPFPPGDGLFGSMEPIVPLVPFSPSEPFIPLMPGRPEKSEKKAKS